MIQTEFYKTRDDGVNLYRTYSDADMMIRKDGTEALYTEAIDIEGSGYTYTEMDIPIEDDREVTLDDAMEMLNELGVDIDEDE